MDALNVDDLHVLQHSHLNRLARTIPQVKKKWESSGPQIHVAKKGVPGNKTLHPDAIPVSLPLNKVAVKERRKESMNGPFR